MGVDLTLIPYERSQWPKKGMLAHYKDNGIGFPRWSAIYDYLGWRDDGSGSDQIQQPAPDRVFVVASQEVFEEYDDVSLCAQEDPYGSPLKYLTAGEILKNLRFAKKAIIKGVLPDTGEAFDNTHDWNELVGPIIKKLSKLKSSTPVILWWH
jgi:hypothetical protein